jgi:WD40 repeat protein
VWAQTAGPLWRLRLDAPAAAPDGQRVRTHELLRRARALGLDDAQRARAQRDWLGALTLTDLVFRRAPGLPGPDQPRLLLANATLDRVALVRDGAVELRRVADAALLARVTNAPPVAEFGDASADGRVWVLRHADSLSVWDLAGGRPLYGPAPLPALHTLAPDGRTLVWAQTAGPLWRLRLDAPAAAPEALGPETGTNEFWRALRFAPDSRQLAVARTGTNLVQVFDAFTGREERHLPQSTTISRLGWTPAGDRVLGGSGDGRLFVNQQPGSPWPFILVNAPADGQTITVDPAARLVATANSDHQAVLSELNTARLLLRLNATSPRLEFSPDGGRLGLAVVGGQPGWWDVVRPGAAFWEAQCGYMGGVIPAASFHPAGDHVLSRFQFGIRLFRAEDGAFLSCPNATSPYEVSFNAAGDALYLSDAAGLGRWPCTRTATGLAFGERESLLAGREWRAFALHPARPELVVAATNAPTLRVLPLGASAAAGTVPEPFAPAGVPEQLVFNPDGRWLAAASPADRQVRVWDYAARRPVWTNLAGVAPRAAFSPDGRWLVTSGERLALHATGTWTPGPQPALPPDLHSVGHAAFSPDGRLLAAVVNLFEIHLYELPSGRLVTVLEGPNQVRLNTLTFSPDGAWLLATATIGKLRAWHLPTLRAELRAEGLAW